MGCPAARRTLLVRVLAFLLVVGSRGPSEKRVRIPLQVHFAHARCFVPRPPWFFLLLGVCVYLRVHVCVYVC